MRAENKKQDQIKSLEKIRNHFNYGNFHNKMTYINDDLSKNKDTLFKDYRS